MNSPRTTFLIATVIFLASLLVMPAANAIRVKDVADVAGVRTNHLVGYGLVVGLPGTGDKTTQAPFTVQSLKKHVTAAGCHDSG